MLGARHAWSRLTRVAGPQLVRGDVTTGDGGVIVYQTEAKLIVARSASSSFDYAFTLFFLSMTFPVLLVFVEFRSELWNPFKLDLAMMTI